MKQALRFFLRLFRNKKVHLTHTAGERVRADPPPAVAREEVKAAPPPIPVGREGYSLAFTDELTAIALKSNGNVQILRHAGRTSKPDSLTLTTLPEPGTCSCGIPFISGRAVINTVHYEFHAYKHPQAKGPYTTWLYFSVVGPDQESSRQSEFQITDAYRWTGSRPLNPLLVKAVLRRWVEQPDVQASIAVARANLMTRL